MLRAVANRANVVRALLLGAAILLLAASVLYNEISLAPLQRGHFTELTRSKIREVELLFAGTGLVLLAASELVRRRPSLVARSSGRFAEILLFVLAGLLPFLIVDFGLRPFVVPKTTLFVQDDDLGWKMKPNARDEWGETIVSTNSKGLRGPEVDYARRPGVARVLFLGDSVTFGYRVEETQAVFPFRVGHELSDALGSEVEVVDSGVGGYSPWQERIYFEHEGLRYSPDVVVVGFVLNDVAEKLTLVRYGGTERGWQLARTARNRLDRWLSGSALFTVLREGAAMLRFGRDVRLGAAEVEMQAVRALSEQPDAPSPQQTAMERTIERAWHITLGNLAAIFDTAKAHGIPGLLVVFPYRFQLEGPPDTEAQQRLAAFAAERGTPFLDLLPLFRSQHDPLRLMIDDSHLSVEGHALAAEAITRRVLDGGMLSRSQRP